MKTISVEQKDRIPTGQWIRIRIQNPDPEPDPGGQKLTTKIEKSKEILCFEVLDVYL
jgi:hypothetical protein